MTRMRATDESATPRRGWWKRAILVVVVATVGVGLQQSGLAETVRLSDLRSARDGLGTMAPFAFVLAFVVFTVAGVPGMILTMTGGLLFGTLGGGLLVEIGASIGATCAFFVARAAGREVIARFIAGNAMERFDRRLTGAGLSAVLFSRIVPVFPFTYMNFVWGVTGVKARDFMIGTTLGMIPASFVYANIAASFARSLEGTDPTLASIDVRQLVNGDVVLAFGLLGLLTVIPIAVRHLVNRRYGVGAKDGDA
ncbi:MAG: TVP38/TMEM64 family protein [Blastocatellia bacterium]|nr:TVP38/TMEM64 family protein [Blastocatellia bacterium]